MQRPWRGALTSLLPMTSSSSFLTPLRTACPRPASPTCAEPSHIRAEAWPDHISVLTGLFPQSRFLLLKSPSLACVKLMENYLHVIGVCVCLSACAPGGQKKTSYLESGGVDIFELPRLYAGNWIWILLSAAGPPLQPLLSLLYTHNRLLLSGDPHSWIQPNARLKTICKIKSRNLPNRHNKNAQHRSIIGLSCTAHERGFRQTMLR